MKHLMRLWLMSCAVAAWLLACHGEALAFHPGKIFDQPPGKGGGGRIFYTGAPLERGWDCTMCHTDPPGKIRLVADVDPPELFKTFKYQLGQTYLFTVKLVGEHLGKQAGRSNFNSFVVTATDAAGIYAGDFTMAPPDVFYTGGNGGVLASDTNNDGDVEWSYAWVAPSEPGVGTVTMYFATVDGNGANSDPDSTRTDPFGDDVFVTHVVLSEGGSTTAQIDKRAGWHVTVPAPPPVGEDRHSSRLAYALLLLAFGAGLGWRGRRGIINA